MLRMKGCLTKMQEALIEQVDLINKGFECAMPGSEIESMARAQYETLKAILIIYALRFGIPLIMLFQFLLGINVLVKKFFRRNS